MIQALDELTELQCVTMQDDDEIEETVVFLYLAIRLKPLLGKYKINENKINNIASFLADYYFDKSISLDIMINSIYNYINQHKKYPPDKVMSDNIEILLNKYAEIKWNTLQQNILPPQTELE